MTVTLRADVYPAQITIGTRPPQDRVRVIVTQGAPTQPDRLIVFADGAPAPRVVYSQPVSDFTPPTKPQRLRELHAPAFSTYTATGPDGSPITFQKTGGCGCGSRLKSFNPFPQIASLNAPAAKT